MTRWRSRQGVGGEHGAARARTAAAVIGGTSLFGGRGKMLHALIGGIVIAAIYNGTGLLGLGAAEQYMVAALALLAAVTVDAVARRGRTAA